MPLWFLDLVMAKEARNNGGAAWTGVKPRAFGSPCWCSLCIYGMCVCRLDMYSIVGTCILMSLNKKWASVERLGVALE